MRLTIRSPLHSMTQKKVADTVIMQCIHAVAYCPVMCSMLQVACTASAKALRTERGQAEGEGSDGGPEAARVQHHGLPIIFILRLVNLRPRWWRPGSGTCQQMGDTCGSAEIWTCSDTTRSSQSTSTRSMYVCIL